MAVLERIRSKGNGKLIIIAIGVALFAFVIGDFLKGEKSFFNQSAKVVATIGKDEVDITEFSAAIDQMTEVYKIETGNQEISDEVSSQLRAQVWENIVNEKLLNAEAEKLGLAVSKQELLEACTGQNTHPLIAQRRVFVDQSGRFSRPALIQFLASLNQPATSAEMQEQIDKAKSYWKFWENAVKSSILQQKYTVLISKVVGANSLDAKMSFEDKKTSYDVNYVVQPYFTVADAEVSVSDADIKAQYEKHKELFKQEENCAIKYVAFDIKPLEEDYKEGEAWVKKMTEELQTTDDVIGLVNSNSDVMYTGKPYSATTIPANLKDFAFSSPAGAVFGPVFVNDTHTIAKVMETGILQSDSVKLRHIFLVKKDAAKSDSIISAIKAGGDFAALARKYSAVKQTAEQGGEIGWLEQGAMGVEKELLEKAFAHAKNEIFTIENEQGVQIMQVEDKTAAKKKVKVAILERKITPSSRSNSKIYNEATAFAAAVTKDNFESVAKEKSYFVRNTSDIMKSTDKIDNITNSRQIVQWVFNSKVGEISQIYTCNNCYVVALSTEVNPKGYRSMDKLKDQLKAEAIREKKADKMIAALKAQLAKDPSLENLAASMKDSVRVAKGVNFAAYQLGMAGQEPSVIGKSAVLADNKVSEPIKGNAGVYVIRTSNKVVSPINFDLRSEQAQLNSRLSYSLPYMIIQHLKEKAEIKDNRLNFF